MIRFLGLLCFSAGSALAGPAALAAPAPSSACVSNQVPQIEFDGDVLLGGGEILVWSRKGQVQIRHKGGGWTPVLHVAEPFVDQVVADREGFLLGRHSPTREVVLIGPDGKKKDHWIVDTHESVALFSQSGQRWLVTNRALLPLLPQSKVGSPEPLPAAFASLPEPVSPPDVLRREDGRWLLCNDPSPYAEGYGSGICERTGVGGWRVTHPYWSAGLLCGKWIVHVGERLVAIRSAETGKLETEKRFAAQPSVICAGDDKLVVGEKTLDLLSLPSLSKILQRTVTRGRVKLAKLGVVKGMAFLGDEIAFSTPQSTGIEVLSLPCALAAGAGKP